MACWLELVASLYDHIRMTYRLTKHKSPKVSSINKPMSSVHSIGLLSQDLSPRTSPLGCGGMAESQHESVADKSVATA